MKPRVNAIKWVAMIIAIFVCGRIVFAAEKPSAEQALKLAPIQQGVDCDHPSAQEASGCTIAAKRLNGQIGWVVEDGHGKILRRFVDTNGDNIVDLWSYYKDGTEIYRDIDANYDGKADQYRWLNSAGTRWGLDNDEDGRVDSWKTISAEEVSAEIVAALAAGDAQRFTRVALTVDELQNLGLGKARREALRKNLETLMKEFDRAANQQKSLSPESHWVQFSAGRPGTVPAGTDDSTKDLKVYENVVAIVETGDKHSQVQIGTLVQVGDTWKAIVLPGEMTEGQMDALAGTFFHAPLSPRPEGPGTGGSEALQDLIDRLAQLDEQMAGGATPELIGGRADLLEKIAAKAGNAEDRTMWLRQLADMISAAVQMEQLPDGIERLEALHEKLQKDPNDEDLAAYVRFAQLTAEHTLNLQAPKAKFPKIQTEWQSALEEFLKAYPSTPVSAEAMLQLAIAEEFAGEDDAAAEWYARVAKEFPRSLAGQKAIGARTRLESEGKAITLSGRGLTGRRIELEQFHGKVVLIQYWATWSEPAQNDMQTLKNLLAKYGRYFTIVGISVDNNRGELEKFLAANRLPWPQIFEEGGLDSPVANQLGILTVPTMILVDRRGRVIHRNIQADEIEKELKKLIKQVASRGIRRSR